MFTASGRPLPWFWIVFALVGLAWLPAVHGGTVDFDSDWMVVQNPILGSGSLEVLPTLFWDLSGPTREAMGAEYLPIRDLTVLLDFAVWGRSWSGHHLQNVLWYALASSLFFVVLQRLFPAETGRMPVRSLLGALAFGLHPLHAEPVAWLAGRKEPVALALALGALLAWMKRRDLPYGSVLALVLYGLACLSKGNVIVLPAVLVALGLLVETPQSALWETLRRPSWWAQWLPWAVVCGSLIALATHVGNQVAFYTDPRADGVLAQTLLQGHLFGHYLLSLAAPFWLAPLYPEPGVLHPTGGAGAVAVVVLMVGTLVLAWSARRAPRLALGLVWFGLGLAPTSAFMPLQTLLADRYALFASCGFVVAGVAVLPERLTARRAAVGAVPVLLLLALLSLRQTLAWRTTAALWTHQVAQQPSVVRGWTSLAGALHEEGRGAAATEVLATAFSRFGALPPLLQTRGWLEMESGDLAAAAETLGEAWRAEPRLRRAGNNLAIALGRLGQPEEAVAVAEEVVSVHPRYSEAWNTLGALHIDRQDSAAAVQALDKAVGLAPWSATAATNRGNAAWLAGDAAGARWHWSRALSLDPGQDAARRGVVHLDRLGR